MQGSMLFPTLAVKSRHVFPTVEINGVRCCAVCGQSREGSVTVHGREMIYDSLCNCDLRNIEKEKEQDEKRRELSRIESLKRQCVKEYHSSLYSFADDDGQDETHLALAEMYVDRFDNERRKGRGLLFMGKPGTGKTFLASCIANALMERLYSCVIVSVPYLVDRFRDFDTRDSAFELINTVDLAVFDDLGAEYSSAFACDKMFQVVNCRYEAKKPSIFTTNLTYEKMKASDNISLARIFERILERSVPCTFTVDRRQANRDAMVKEFGREFIEYTKEKKNG